MHLLKSRFQIRREELVQLGCLEPLCPPDEKNRETPASFSFREHGEPSPLDTENKETRASFSLREHREPGASLWVLRFVRFLFERY